MKRICTICARAGSKGVPNKNVREILGKPLMVYSILQAKESNLFDIIAVSSDSQRILEIAKQYEVNCIIERPAELATDKAAKLPVIKHCIIQSEQLTNLSFDTIVDLDVTSPLRSVQDIHKAVALLESQQVSNVITGTPARRSPYFNLVEKNEKGRVQLSKPLAVPVVRRQDTPACYDMNASIYCWTYQGLFDYDSLFHNDTLLYEMPAERSLDIDSEIDFEIVEFLLKKREKDKDDSQ